MTGWEEPRIDNNQRKRQVTVPDISAGGGFNGYYIACGRGGSCPAASENKNTATVANGFAAVKQGGNQYDSTAQHYIYER